MFYRRGTQPQPPTAAALLAAAVVAPVLPSAGYGQQALLRNTVGLLDSNDLDAYITAGRQEARHALDGYRRPA